LTRTDGAGAVAEIEFGGRDDRLEKDGVVGVDEAAALLGDRLKLRAAQRRHDGRRRRLKDGLEDGRVDAAVLRDEKGGDAREVGRGHRRARHDRVRAFGDGVGREDVAARRGDRRLQVGVVRQAVRREVRDEAGSRLVLEVEVAPRERRRCLGVGLERSKDGRTIALEESGDLDIDSADVRVEEAGGIVEDCAEPRPGSADGNAALRNSARAERTEHDLSSCVEDVLRLDHEAADATAEDDDLAGEVDVKRVAAKVGRVGELERGDVNREGLRADVQARLVAVALVLVWLAGDDDRRSGDDEAVN
jgi:hypothetical protein